MSNQINFRGLVFTANETFPAFGITEIATNVEGFDSNEVVTMSEVMLPTTVREWIKAEVLKIEKAVNQRGS